MESEYAQTMRYFPQKQAKSRIKEERRGGMEGKSRRKA
jgi:hypothetical protein